MEIKYKLVLNGTTWAAAYNIEYNTIGVFQTSNSNTPGYYIFWWTGNAYTLQEQYTCHAFNPTVIITEGELFFPAKFMIPMIKTSYWYHEPEINPCHGEVKTSFYALHWIDSEQKYSK